jgi:hypothetical protein
MPAAANADRQALIAGEAHRGDDVAGTAGPGDQRGTAVDRAVPHRPSSVVPLITRQDELPTEISAQPAGSGPDQCGHHGSLLLRPAQKA